MARCQKIRKKKRQYCAGDLRDRITLHDRSITPPVAGTPDFEETFTPIAEVWSAINTVTGKTFFDGVNTDVNITHEIGIRYDPTVTAETWVEFNGQRIDILDVEDLEERHEWMKLTCTVRGSTAKNASKA